MKIKNNNCEDYKEIHVERKRPVLTEDDITVLKALKIMGYHWIAEDKNGGISFAYIEKPTKYYDDGIWGNSTTYSVAYNFPFLSWEDSEPTNIDWLLVGFGEITIMSKLTRKAEVRPTINFPMLDGETLEEACDRFFNYLDKFNCFYVNSYHEEYVVDEEGNEKSTIKTVVIVKHENCGAKYVFLVPEGKKLKAGDLVMVNTKHGKALATCLCDSFVVDMSDTDKVKSIFTAFGVNEPTAYVIGKLNCVWWDK